MTVEIEISVADGLTGNDDDVGEIEPGSTVCGDVRDIIIVDIIVEVD
jgi:hypothetical protein